MLKKSQSSIVKSNRIGIFAVLCGIALIASACGGAVVNSPDSTPNTGVEVVSPTEQSTEVASETPAALPQASGADKDICSLITTTEAEGIMGQPVASITPGSEPDSVFGETLFSCVYLGKDLAVVVSSVDLGSAQAASEKMQQQLVKEQADEGVVISEEPGLGDKAYWTIAENAGIYSVLKGRHIFVVLLGGNIGDAAAYKAPLLNLAKSVSSKY